ncbi:hypothetical protein, partial [Vibrio navarrensis]|uniref:hypothetical protein n=1 Tax=Vibrio navarrensis TaxID=29495 RepID=UPI0029C0B682
REVSQLAAKSIWKFCFRFEFSESDLSKFTGFQASERSQSLSCFGFQSLGGLLVFQIELISGLVNLTC